MRRREGQSIEMLATDHGYFPASFRWRGRRFDVVAVERCWTETGQCPRRLFQVRCAAGVFVVEQRLPAGMAAPGLGAGSPWRVKRWPAMLWLAGLRRPRAPRYPLPKGQRRRRSMQPRPPVLAKLVARQARPVVVAVRRDGRWTADLPQP